MQMQARAKSITRLRKTKLLVYLLSYLASLLCSFPYRLGEGGLNFDTSRRRRAKKREPTRVTFKKEEISENTFRHTHTRARASERVRVACIIHALNIIITYDST